MDPKTVRYCPWCGYPAQKDDACNYVVCGEFLDAQRVQFNAAIGCGRAWCFLCAKKLCGRVYVEGVLTNASRSHSAECCLKEAGFQREDYCPGGHNSHK